MADDLTKLLANIHPDVLAATCDELDAAGWGSVPRRFIPADWRAGAPAARNTGGRQPMYRTQEERKAAGREARRKYDAKRRGGKTELCKAHRCCSCRRIVKGTLCHCGHQGCLKCPPYRSAKRV